MAQRVPDYSWEGVRLERTGEVRCPRRGEYFLVPPGVPGVVPGPALAHFNFTREEYVILAPRPEDAP